MTLPIRSCILAPFQFDIYRGIHVKTSVSFQVWYFYAFYRSADSGHFTYMSFLHAICFMNTELELFVTFYKEFSAKLQLSYFAFNHTYVSTFTLGV